jgi:hypothetical protein
MTTPRDIRLAPADLALKLAFREAVAAAGGQELVARESGKTQSRISDYGSPNTADFAPLDVVRRVEALGFGAPGHPHVTRALARASGAALSPALPPASGLADLGDHLAAIARETADLAGALAGEDLSAACTSLSLGARLRIGREAAEAIDQLEQLQRALAEENGVRSRLSTVGDAGGAVEAFALRRRASDSS